MSRIIGGVAGITFTNDPLSLSGGDSDRDSENSNDRSAGAELIPFIPCRTKWARFRWSGDRGEPVSAMPKSLNAVAGGRYSDGALLLNCCDEMAKVGAVTEDDMDRFRGSAVSSTDPG